MTFNPRPNAAAEAHKRKDATAAEERRLHDEQTKAEAAASKIKAEADAAEMLRRSAEANIAALQKQVRWCVACDV